MRAMARKIKRKIKIKRKTKETSIILSIDLNGRGIFPYFHP